MWNWLLVKLGLRTDWSNPDNAPPGLSDDEEPHDFSPFEGVPCCGRCGGGRLHSVHHGEAFHRKMGRGHQGFGSASAGFFGLPGKREQPSDRRSGEGDDV